MKKECNVVAGVKGFNSGLICNPEHKVSAQYAENSVFSVSGKLRLCDNGIHFCKDPLYTFYFYPPDYSEYAFVEAVGSVIDGGDKCCTRRLVVHNKLSLFDLGKLSLKLFFKGSLTKRSSRNSDIVTCTSEEDSCKAVYAEAPFSVACTTRTATMAVITARYSCAVVTAPYSMAVISGISSVAVATHDKSAAVSTSCNSVAVCTSDQSRASCKGVYAVAVASGIHSTAEALEKGALAIAAYIGGRVRRVKGSYLVCNFCPEEGESPEYRMVKVDGVEIKENTWYRLSPEGKWVEDND